MRIVFLILLCAEMVFISCLNSKETVTEQKDCLHTINALAVDTNNWKYDKSRNHYYMSTLFAKQIDTLYRKCINSLKYQDLLTLFGNPTESHVNDKKNKSYTIDYLISKPCKNAGEGSSSCDYYIFYVDSTNKVYNSEIRTYFGSTQY